jgi:hypothetical protein
MQNASYPEHGDTLSTEDRPLSGIAAAIHAFAFAGLCSPALRCAIRRYACCA